MVLIGLVLASWRRIQSLRLSCYCLVLVFTTGEAFAESPTMLVLAAHSLADKRVQDFSETVLREALQRVQVGLVVVELPAKRAALALQAGSVDGLLPYTGMPELMEPRLVRIPESIFNYRVAVYSTPGAASVSDLLTAQSPPVIVAYRRQLKAMAYRLLQPYGDLRLSPVAGARAGLNSMYSGRSRAYLDLCFLADPVFDKSNGTVTQVSRVEVLESANAYGFLHSKHSRLATRLGAEVKAMKSEGLVNAWFIERFPHDH